MTRHLRRAIGVALVWAVAPATVAAQQPSSNDLLGKSLEELMNVEVASVIGAAKHEQRVTEAPSSVTIVTDPLHEAAPGRAWGGEQLPARRPGGGVDEGLQRQVLEALLPFYVNRHIYQLVLSAKASEHSARMVAMKTAKDNATKLLGDLTLEYNKARQAGITQEILEIAAAQFAAT